MTRTWTATDACGNTSTASQTISVQCNATCPPASTATPVVDGYLDPSYQFFKNISNSVPLNNLYSRGTVYKFEDATYLYLAFVESRSVNDNVYSSVPAEVTYAGWGLTKGHKFGDLLGSDKVQIQLLNASSVPVFDVIFDYLFQENVGTVLAGYNSGLISELTPGRTTPKYEGSLSTALGYGNVIKSQTSEDYNQGCNLPLATFNTKSPQPEANYASCWEYRYIYEVKILKAGLAVTWPLEPSKLNIPLVHNSPPKSAPGISGFKYCDANGNGAWDAGEVGLGGWTINLSGPTNASTTTNANGFYEFFNIATGAYTLSEVAQTGYVQTQSPAGFTLAANQLVTDRNFGNKPTCAPLQAGVLTDPLLPLADVAGEASLDVQIYPNPFSTMTEIFVTPSVDTKALVEVYDMQGRKIKTLFDGKMEAGIRNAYRFTDADSRSKQLYMCVIRTDLGTTVKKFIKTN
jgi:hypothetical protein